MKPTLSPQRGPLNGRYSNLAVRGIALIVFVLGLLNLWSALLARDPSRIFWLRHTAHLPLVVEHASRTLIALFGLGLLMLARSLARHKRQAWGIALFLSVLSPLPHVVKGLDYEEAILCLLMVGILLVFRHAFYAQNDRPSARQGMLAAALLFGFAAIYGPVGFYLLRDEFRPAFSLRRASLQTTHKLFYMPPRRALVAQSRRARWFDTSLLTISLCATSYGVFMLLRPVLPREKHAVSDRETARKLLHAWPADPLSYFALLPDKQYLFDPAERSDVPPAWGIAYVVAGGTAVALGDPLGNPARAADAIAAFLHYCKSHDWSPAFYQTTNRNLPLCKAARLRVLKVGEDAILDVPTWNMKGKAFQDLRTAINKMGKMGIVFEPLDPHAPDAADALTQMDAISEAWLRAHKGEEKTFALGRFEPESDSFADERYFLARETETGRVLAFVSFVPIWGRGWGLDLMRRDANAPNGVMEFLIASSVLQFQTEGAAIVSMGLSPLSGGDKAEPGESELAARGRALLYERFNYFYAFKGLHAFKEKFGPQWEPRYLIYPSDTVLAQTILAVIRAHSPRGLLTFLITPK